MSRPHSNSPKHVQTGGTGSKPIHLGISKCGNAELRTLLVQGAMSALNAVRVGRDAQKSQENRLRRRRLKRIQWVRPIEMQIPLKEREMHNIQVDNEIRKKEKGEKKIMSKNRVQWLLKLYEAKGTQKTAVALANKTARMIHAILKSSGPYQHDLAYSAHGQKSVGA